MPNCDELIFDWNEEPAKAFCEINDETLREGVQSASFEPELSLKCELLDAMAAIGVRAASLGLPAASPRALREAVALARHISDARLELEANCAARTLVEDVVPIVEAAQRSGRAIVAHTFIGASAVRMWSEDWDLPFLLSHTASAVSFAVKEGLSVGFVAEDTTRASPDVLGPLFRTAIDHGASRLVLCDTAGHATPSGTRALVRWVRNLVGDAASIEWHGHNDRGLSLVNALAAIEEGVQRVHTCGLGLGERVGNTPTELLLLNVKLLGWTDRDLASLPMYGRKVAEAFRVSIPSNYPLLGAEAFSTGTGVHAAAIAKALALGEPALADRVYSVVPAAEFGRTQEIHIGPMAGMSNVRLWLSRRGIVHDSTLCRKILDAAKSSTSPLSDAAILSIVHRHTRAIA